MAGVWPSPDASDRVHIIGLVSGGGVHLSLEHLEALIDMAARSRSLTSSCMLSPTAGTRATYGHKPAMSAPEAAQALISAWAGDEDGARTGGYQFGIINFANADMVGHTGVIPPAIEAVQTVDRYWGRWSRR